MSGTEHPLPALTTAVYVTLSGVETNFTGERPKTQPFRTAFEAERWEAGWSLSRPEAQSCEQKFSEFRGRICSLTGQHLVDALKVTLNSPLVIFVWVAEPRGSQRKSRRSKEQEAASTPLSSQLPHFLQISNGASWSHSNKRDDIGLLGGCLDQELPNFVLYESHLGIFTNYRDTWAPHPRHSDFIGLA